MDSLAWGPPYSSRGPYYRLLYMAEPDASLSMAAYEAGKLGTRIKLQRESELRGDFASVAGQTAVARARVFKVFASHIASLVFRSR